LLGLLPTSAVQAYEDCVDLLLGYEEATSADNNGDGVLDAADFVTLVENSGAADDMAVLRELESVYGDHAGKPLDDQRTAILAHLASSSKVAASGVSEDGCVWARLNSGLPVLFMTNEEQGPEPQVEVTRSAGGFMVSRSVAAQMAERGDVVRADSLTDEILRTALPMNNQAMLILSTGDNWPSFRWAYHFWEALVKNGMKVPEFGTQRWTDLSNYRHIPSVSVFINQGHGGLYSEKDFNPESTNTTESILAIWTNCYVNESDLVRYAPEKEALRAIPSIGGNDKVGDTVVKATKWAITAGWVREYFKFQPASVWSNQSCSGYNAAMIAAAKAKGLDTYIGWTKPIWSNNGPANSAILLSRTMGTPYTNTGDPLFRPYPLDDAYREAVKRGWNKDGFKNAELKIARKTDSVFLEIAPSIRWVKADPPNDLLMVHGVFGDDPGEGKRLLTVGGTPIEIRDWSNWRIEAILPRTGPGSSGDVVARRRGFTSNKKPLVLYETTMTVDLYHSSGAALGELSANLTFRIDPLPYRRSPILEPMFFDQEMTTLTTSPDPMLAMIYLTRSYEFNDPNPHDAIINDMTSHATYNYGGSYGEESCGTISVSGGGGLDGYPIQVGAPIPPGEKGLVVILAWITHEEPHRYELGPGFLGCDGTFDPSDPDCDSWEHNALGAWITSIKPEIQPSEDHGLAGGEEQDSQSPTTLKWTEFKREYVPDKSKYPL
jgi:hypothetical protein